MTIIPEVLEALDRAARAQSASRVRRHRWSGRRMVVLGFSVLTVGSALAATTPWQPQVGDQRRGHPTLSSSPVPSDQLAALAVLRRAQSSADRGSQVQAVLRLIGSEVSGVRLAGVRLLATRADGAIVLVPLERESLPHMAGPSSSRHNLLCVEDLMTPAAGTPAGSTTPSRTSTDPTTTVQGHLVQPAPRPASRRPARAATNASPPVVRRDAARRSRPSDTPSVTTVIASSCGTAVDLREGRITGAASANGGRFHLYGLVPDGVDRVAIDLQDGTTKLIAVHNNTYDLPAPGPEIAAPNRIRWLDAAGHDIARSPR